MRPQGPYRMGWGPPIIYIVPSVVDYPIMLCKHPHMWPSIAICAGSLNRERGLRLNVVDRWLRQRLFLPLSFHVYPFGVHVKSCSFYEPKRPIRKMIMNLRTFRFLKTRNRNITSICESRLVLARLRSQNHDQVFRPGRRGPSACKQTVNSKQKTQCVHKFIHSRPKT